MKKVLNAVLEGRSRRRRPAAWKLVLLACAIPLVGRAVGDMQDFHEAQRVAARAVDGSGQPQRVMYSTNWLARPYTNARLAFLPTREVWVEDRVLHERWLVREVRVGEVIFWTRLTTVYNGITT